MRIRTLVAATSAALFSLGAIAAGEKEQQSQTGMQQQGAQGSQQSAAAGASQQQAGMDQSAIRQAQEKLKQEGHYDGQVDGILGPRTHEALREFQQQEGLQATGQLNEETLSALDVDAQASGSASGQGAQSGQYSQQSQSGQGQSQAQASSGSAFSPEVIKQVQQNLNEKGHDAGPVDGRWGPLTQRAVQNFQEMQDNLQASGRLDRQTLSALGVDIEGGAATGGSAAQGQTGERQEQQQRGGRTLEGPPGQAGQGAGSQAGSGASGASGSQTGSGGSMDQDRQQK